ncbi:MAG: hypothetical protein O7D29_01915 [Gemmatimonadetes bacterium]|nr:hypothetical protein [Gemmatimonadota bacterium]
MTTEIVKLQGAAYWGKIPDEFAEGLVMEAILRPKEKEFAMELNWEGQSYSVELRRKEDGAFRGGWTCYPREGTAECRLFPSGNLYFLWGTWIEDGGEYKWSAKLKKVERFSREPIPKPKRSRKTG